MKRIILMLTVAALMVAAMTVTAAGAFASPASDACAAQNDPANGTTANYVKTGPGTYECQITTTTASNPGSPTRDNAATPKHTQDTSGTKQNGQGGGSGEALPAPPPRPFCLV